MVQINRFIALIILIVSAMNTIAMEPEEKSSWSEWLFGKRAVPEHTMLEWLPKELQQELLHYCALGVWPSNKEIEEKIEIITEWRYASRGANAIMLPDYEPKKWLKKIEKNKLAESRDAIVVFVKTLNKRHNSFSLEELIKQLQNKWYQIKLCRLGWDKGPPLELVSPLIEVALELGIPEGVKTILDTMDENKKAELLHKALFNPSQLALLLKAGCSPDLLIPITQESEIVNITPLLGLFLTARHREDVGDEIICAKILLDHGADPLITHPRNGKTILHYCFPYSPYFQNFNFREKKQAFLLHFLQTFDGEKRRQLINMKSKEGLTPLMLAAYEGNLKYVKLFLEWGADASTKDNKRDNAIFYYAAGYSLHLASPAELPKERKQIKALLQEAIKKQTAPKKFPAAFATLYE